MVGLALVACLLAGACGDSSSRSFAPDTSKGGVGLVTLTGTVTDANLRPIGGGVIEVLTGSTSLRTIDVSTGGSFSVASLAAGTYTIRLHPPFAYSLGPNEPDERTLTIAAGSTPQPLSFTVQSALWADDFQSYTSLSQIIAFCNGTQKPGDFFFGAGRDGNCVHTDNMAFDPSGGPNGTKALRYDFPARPTGTSNYTISLLPRLNPLPAAGSSEIWVRFTDRMSPNFKIGGAGCGGSSCEYKYLFIDLIMPGWGVGTFTFELDSQQGGAPNSLVQARFKLFDPRGNGVFTDGTPGAGTAGLDEKMPASFYGAWNTWVVGITGIGSPRVTAVTYRNGTLVKTFSTAWFPNTPIPANAALTLQMGANINNGPDAAQQRWWREVGVYKSRPSLLPLVP